MKAAPLPEPDGPMVTAWVNSGTRISSPRFVVEKKRRAASWDRWIGEKKMERSFSQARFRMGSARPMIIPGFAAE